MISDQQKDRVLSLIQTIERELITNEQTISQVCTLVREESELLLLSNDSLAPILRTALVINWREAAMKPRYERFRRLFPEISGVADLHRVIRSMGALDFCRQYLDISANPVHPERNPKYKLLRELTEGFLAYMEHFEIADEMAAIRHWATRLDIANVKSDFIGRRKGIGIGVAENIRLNLGYAVMKPDRHVIGVMRKYLGVDVRFEQYNDFSNSIGVNPRYLDCLLFEYGKLKRISA